MSQDVKFNIKLTIDGNQPLLGLVKDALFSGNRANASTVVTAAVAPVRIVLIEDKIIVAVVLVEILCRRQVYTTDVLVNAEVREVACGRQKYTIAIRSCELTTFHTVYGSPCVGAIVQEFLNLVKCWHLPVAPPVHMCHVIFYAGDI